MTYDCDVAIIGSGVAGLICGGLLAKKGVKVIICEKHTSPGGNLSSFERKGFIFDTGPHWIIRCGPGELMYNLFDKIGILKELKFIKYNLLPWDLVLPDGEKNILPETRKEFHAYLKDKFPGEANALDKYFDEVDKAGKDTLPKIFSKTVTPLSELEKQEFYRLPAVEYIDQHFTDKNLKLILSYTAYPYARTSMALMAGYWKEVDSQTNYYPVGGMQGVANALAEGFKSLGGELLLKTRVNRILIEKGKAVGIEIAGGKRISSRFVVSNADARLTYLGMIGKDFLPHELIKNLDEWKPEKGAFYVYLGVDMDLKKAGMGKKGIWYIPRYNLFGKVIEGNGEDLLPLPYGLLVTVPSLMDPSIAPPGKHCVLLCSCYVDHDFHNNWQTGPGGRRTPEYRRLKKVVADQFIDYAEKILPGLRKSIVVMDTASPLTYERYTFNYKGSQTGWSWEAETGGKRLDQASCIKNLYLAGHWTAFPGGVAAAALSGMRTAETILSEP